MTNVLKVEGLCKRYEGFFLDHVSFEVGEGRIMGFIGRNGAGKTTTLKSILNLVNPDGGRVELFSGQYGELAEKQLVGFASGGIDYYPKKKISLISAVTKSFYTNWDENAYRRYMETFGISEKKTPDQLSAGMKVKYSLALALSHNAKLLILDEPTSGLDPVSRDDILDVFLSLADEGITILFSTHITTDLEKCADDITYIKQGRIIASERMEDFLSKYRVAVISEEELPSLPGDRLIGLKRAKHGYTALVDAADTLGLTTQDADLEALMVHLDKEEI